MSEKEVTIRVKVHPVIAQVALFVAVNFGCIYVMRALWNLWYVMDVTALSFATFWMMPIFMFINLFYLCYWLDKRYSK